MLIVTLAAWLTWTALTLLSSSQRIEYGVTVSYETTRSGCQDVGRASARAVCWRKGLLGDLWHEDGMWVKAPVADVTFFSEQQTRAATLWTSWSRGFVP